MGDDGEHLAQRLLTHAGPCTAIAMTYTVMCLNLVVNGNGVPIVSWGELDSFNSPRTSSVLFPLRSPKPSRGMTPVLSAGQLDGVGLSSKWSTCISVSAACRNPSLIHGLARREWSTAPCRLKLSCRGSNLPVPPMSFTRSQIV